MAPLSAETGYTANIKVEKLLNAAILDVDVREDFYAFLAIVDRFYADDIEVHNEGDDGALMGKAAVRSRIASFAAALHVFAEVGGLRVSIQGEPIPSDTRHEMHSVWTLELTGVTGRQCVLRWRACRRWRDGLVAYERFSEIEQIGGPLTADDLDLRP